MPKKRKSKVIAGLVLAITTAGALAAGQAVDLGQLIQQLKVIVH